MPKIGKKIIQGRFVLPSGIVGTCLDTLAKIAKEIPEVGILTTKSITLEKREGNPEPILDQVGPSSFINAVGLTNPGAKYFTQELKKIYPLPYKKFLLVSIAAATQEELSKIIKIISPSFDGIELNLSCPHGEKYGLIIGKSGDLSFAFTKTAREITKKPIFVKLPPRENVGEVAKAVIKAGADGISAINTVGPIENRTISFGKGGMSGSKIKKRGIKCIEEISKAIQGKIPIIAMGGIRNARDIKLYEKAGADFFGIGSALTEMSFEKMKEYFKTLGKDLKNDTNLAENFPIERKIIDYKPFRIKKIQKLDKDLRIFSFNKSFKAQPGQFIFLNINGREKPFSLASVNPLILAIRKVGNFTSQVFKLKEKDKVLIRGPYGKPFPVTAAKRGHKLLKREKSYLICGGTGTAPLYFLAQKLKEPTIFLASRTRRQLLFKKEFKKLGETILITEDGSEGEKGRVTEILEKYLKKARPRRTIFYNCGPELMMEKAMEIERRYTTGDRIFASIERYAKCGIGLCGHCAINSYRSCVDGPVFDFNSLSQLSHFAKFKRDKTGRLVKI